MRTVTEAIFQCVGSVLSSTGSSQLCVLSPGAGKILFGVLLEKSTGLGRRWTFFFVNGFPDFHHEYLWLWVFRLGDCSASSPMGLTGFFIDFGVLASTSLQILLGCPLAHPSLTLGGRGVIPLGSKLTFFFRTFLLLRGHHLATCSADLHFASLCWTADSRVKKTVPALVTYTAALCVSGDFPCGSPP